MTLTEQEQKQIELGTAATKLLEDPFFAFLMTEMSNAYMSGLIQTKSNETEEREGFYHAIKALNDIGGTLSHWVQVKDGLMAAVAEQDNTED